MSIIQASGCCRSPPSETSCPARVRVADISLNLAISVDPPAADSCGPQAGARVVGLLRTVAHVVAHVRRSEQIAKVKQAGAQEVMGGADVSEAPSPGPYDLIIDSVGGKALATALGQTATGGV
jgi:hypothetical protein